MIVFSQNGKKVVKAEAFFIAVKTEMETVNGVTTDKPVLYEVKASLANGRTETIISFKEEKRAFDFMEQLALDFNANTRAKEEAWK